MRCPSMSPHRSWPVAPISWPLPQQTGSKSKYSRSKYLWRFLWAGPHAFLSLISMAAGEGHVINGEDMLPDAVALAAIERLMRLAQLAPKGSDTLNPIALLEMMAKGDDIALVPLIFGYVNYAQRGFGKHRLAFSDTIRGAGGYGGVLGGTGIAFSRRCSPSQALLDHVAWLMDAHTQSTFFPDHNGQPSARAAWQSQRVNAASGNFYADTAKTRRNRALTASVRRVHRVSNPRVRNSARRFRDLAVAVPNPHPYSRHLATRQRRRT